MALTSLGTATFTKALSRTESTCELWRSTSSRRHLHRNFLQIRWRGRDTPGCRRRVSRHVGKWVRQRGTRKVLSAMDKRDLNCIPASRVTTSFPTGCHMRTSRSGSTAHRRIAATGRSSRTARRAEVISDGEPGDLHGLYANQSNRSGVPAYEWSKDAANTGKCSRVSAMEPSV